MSTGILILGTSGPATADVSEMYIGEVLIVPGSFCPRGSMSANGQLLSINSYTALFSLLGTTYGGDGRTNFRLPNIAGRSAIHHSTRISQGRQGGIDQLTLTINQLPAHQHTDKHVHLVPPHKHSGHFHTHNARGGNNNNTPVGNSIRTFSNRFATGSANAGAMASGSVKVDSSSGAVTGQHADEPTSSTGNGVAIESRDPYLAVHYCIVLDGVYPSR
jgi:microcystin-dependent protein